MARSRTTRTVAFFARLFVVLMIIFSILFSGYAIIDRVVIPKYFGEYGIRNMSDLVGMVRMMHKTPEEKDFITHAFTSADEVSAVGKMQNAFIPVVNGKVDFNLLINGPIEINPELQETGEYFTDCEMAAILDQMLQSGILASQLENLSYIDTLNINSREMIVLLIDAEAESPESSTKISNKATISLTVKIDMSNALKHMATHMDVPQFLLNLIIPKTIYVTTTYDVSINASGEYSTSNSSIGVNGRNPKQSKILLNLLIAFIFPKNERMTIEKLGETFAEIANKGLELLGDVKFTSKSTKSNGLTIVLSSKSEPEPETPDQP